MVSRVDEVLPGLGYTHSKYSQTIERAATYRHQALDHGKAVLTILQLQPLTAATIMLTLDALTMNADTYDGLYEIEKRRGAPNNRKLI